MPFETHRRFMTGSGTDGAKYPILRTQGRSMPADIQERLEGL